MPRNTKGIGRTGSKHKNNAVADPDAQSTISEGVSGPPSNPVPQKTATAVDKVAAQTGPAPSVEDPVGDFSWLGADRPATYVPCPHPRNADPSWNGFEQVGYRGHGACFGDERWDPDVPPCVVSDKRPTGVFGSEEAAMAVEAARVRERCMPEKFVGDEGMYNEEEEEVARLLHGTSLEFGVREKNQGMFCIITRGQGGFRSWSLVFWNHQRQCFPHTIVS